MSREMNLAGRKITTTILIVITLTAIGLRLYGINFGLPYSYHDDEDRLVHHALAFGSGDLNPHYFNYPSFLMYILFGFYGVLYVAGRVFGFYASTPDFIVHYIDDPTIFYLVGRTVTVLFGVGTILLCYVIGSRLYSKRAGIFAALIVAVLPLHVICSHYVTTDVPMTFFMVATAYFGVRIFQDGKTRHYVYAAIMTGFGAACKYNGILAAIFILVAHMAVELRNKGIKKALFDKRLIYSGAVILMAFFCATPFCLLDFRSFIKDFRFDAEHIRNGVYGLSSGFHWLDYFKMLVTDELYSWPNPVSSTVGILLISGILYALYKRSSKEALMGIFPFFYFCLIGSWAVVNRRYFLPVIPFCAILSGAALEALSKHPLFYSKRRAAIWAVAAMMLLLPFWNSLRSDYVMHNTDTRTIARDWIEANVPEGAKIALEWDTNATVPLDESKENIRKKIEAYESGGKEGKHLAASQMAFIHKMRYEIQKSREYDIVRIGQVEGIRIIPLLYDASALAGLGVEYVVVSSFVADTFKDEAAERTYPEQVEFYRDLDNEAVLIKAFNPETGRIPGPTVLIYRMKPTDKKLMTRIN